VVLTACKSTDPDLAVSLMDATEVLPDPIVIRRTERARSNRQTDPQLWLFTRPAGCNEWPPEVETRLNESPSPG
jgi:hypothetical protein